MQYRKRYRKNSKNNPWRNTWQDKQKTSINGRKVVAAMLLLSIPLLCVGLVNGLLSRSADMYQFNLRSSEALTNSAYYVNEEELMDLMGDFMTGKTDDFSLKEDVEFEPEEVFGPEDKQAMLRYRKIMTLELYIGIGGGVLTLLIFALLMGWKEKTLHRWGVKLAGVGVVFLVVLDALCKCYPPMRTATYGRYIGVSLPEGDFLRELASYGFDKQFALFTAVAAPVIYLLLVYVTWHFASKRKMFRGAGIAGEKDY